MSLVLVTLGLVYLFVAYKVLAYTLSAIKDIDYALPETRHVHMLEAIAIGLLWPIFFYILVLFLRRARDL